MMSVPNLSSTGCLGAQLESVRYNLTEGRTTGQTPGEKSANSGPARLVQWPKLNNLILPISVLQKAQFLHLELFF